MKIIYDEQKAILEKQQRDIEVPIINRKAKIYNTILAIITIIVIACIGTGWWYILERSACASDTWVFAIPLGIVTVIIGSIAVRLSKNTIWDCEKYSANTKYYILKGNKKVIDHRLRYDRNGEYCLWLVLEDENHFVTERLLWPDTFIEQQQTNLTETTVDLENCIVYKPYSKEDYQNANHL